MGVDLYTGSTYTRVNTVILYSSEYCLVNSQLARNKVRVKGIEILSAASLLSTDIFVYTQFGDTYKCKYKSEILANQHLSKFVTLIANPHPKFEFV